MIVHDGYWEICEDIDFRGGCEVYDAGRHADLRGMSNRVSSIRPVAGPGPRSRRPGPGGGGRVELFDGNRFEGRAFAVNGPVANFPTGVQRSRPVDDRPRRPLGDLREHRLPRRLPDLRSRPSCESRRDGEPRQLDPPRVRSRPRPPASAAGAAARGPCSTKAPTSPGAPIVINTEVMPNLDGARFNDRASSLRVEGGYWLFCSDVNFRGECLTFGPGDYPTLPWSLNNRISSGRRIHEQYPYSQNPEPGRGADVAIVDDIAGLSPDPARSPASSPWSGCRRTGIVPATSRRNTCRSTGTGSFRSIRTAPKCSARPATRRSPRFPGRSTSSTASASRRRCPRWRARPWPRARRCSGCSSAFAATRRPGSRTTPGSTS